MKLSKGEKLFVISILTMILGFGTLFTPDFGGLVGFVLFILGAVYTFMSVGVIRLEQRGRKKKPHKEGMPSAEDF